MHLYGYVNILGLSTGLVLWDEVPEGRILIFEIAEFSSV